MRACKSKHNDECKVIHYCRCSMLALEPNEDCPIHGCGPYTEKCGYCGRFMPGVPLESGEGE